VTFTYLGNIEVDVEKPIVGLDPIMVLGGAVILGGGFGYLLTPFLCTAIFNLQNEAVIQPFKLMDEKLMMRIKRNRLTHSSRSFSNPVPDYYEERIYSLKDYR